jgi:hypothetical protein
MKKPKSLILTGLATNFSKRRENFEEAPVPIITDKIEIVKKISSTFGL